MVLSTFVREDDVTTVEPDAGPVEVFYSTVSNAPKWHASWMCDGLEHARAGAVTSRDFPGLIDAGLDPDGRPCRMCLLEPVLTYTLSTRPRGEVLATFSVQPRPVENHRRYRWREASESARARLSRVLDDASVPAATSTVGPVGYTFVDATVLAVLNRNVRTLVLPSVTELPPRDTIALAWTMWTDDPPEWSAASCVHPDVVRRTGEGYELASLLAPPAVDTAA